MLINDIVQLKHPSGKVRTYIVKGRGQSIYTVADVDDPERLLIWSKDFVNRSFEKNELVNVIEDEDSGG